MALAHYEPMEYQVRQIGKQDNYSKSICKAQVKCKKKKKEEEEEEKK